ncbi:MAG: chromosome segregation protein SMC, partial [Vicinamibacteraceae bacterium]|nr:chromosome segregation protein SMC [Vicinamibacteraceae bacterium]
MRLDRLEISGFKSFPERADVHFDGGVTAIVGPNGCGKSNVVDAITWVLGEQSAKSLRGERMEDVIFSGSDARKPTAAAEVRLRLSGVAARAVRRAAERRGDGEAVGVEDADVAPPEQIELPETERRDVELARRLYRSGESEYLIDGETCRLRDIQDLLMDAGIGVKGYAVIEQGKIGQILSAKPTDRRTLIEEAAGVTKYKSRRRTAELKLDAAQQNLARVEDIIFELDRQRNSLKRQAARARRYRKLREELRRWEKVQFARRHHALAEAIATARARIEAARAREADALAAVEAIDEQREALRRRVAEAETRLTTAREAAHARELEKGRREQQLAFDRQQVETLVAAIAAMASELAGLDARVEPARLELAERREAAATAEREGELAAEKQRSEDEAHREALQAIEALEREVDEVRSRVLHNASSSGTLRNVIERAMEAHERLGMELSRFEAESSDLGVERAQRQRERDEAEKALAAVRDAIETVRTDRAALEDTLARARETRDAHVQALRTRERELSGLAARLTSLEELDASREGFGEAARHVLADADLGLAHLGPVADYVETEPAYERAVEAALGDLLQAVLVATHEDARRGLDLVRQRNFGRCTFVVAGDAGPAPRETVEPGDGVIPIERVLSVAGPHAGVIRSLVGSTWLADTYDAAVEASRRLPGVVATAAGDVFEAGRRISGGSRAEARGILATKREIKELRDRLDAEHAAVERMAGESADLDARIRTTDEALARASAELHQHEKAAVGHELQVNRSDAEIARLARKAEQVALERRRAEEERTALGVRQDEARQSVANLDVERRELDEQFAAAQRRLVDARERAAAQGRRAADARAEAAALAERASGLASEVRRLEEAARELEARIAARRDESTQSEARRVGLLAAIAEGTRLLADDETAFADLTGRVRQADQEVAGAQQDAAGVDDEMKRARLALDEIRAELGQLEIARATSEADFAHLAESCLETLQATIDEVTVEVDAMEAQGDITPDRTAIAAVDAPEPDEEAAAAEDERVAGVAGPEGAEAAAASDIGAEAGVAVAIAAPPARPMTADEAIAALKAKIDRLGPVNMMAIEQFDELEGRHAFLTTQRQDLVDSIAQTGEAIKRIEKTTRERFREAFTAINQYFGETFTTLFGGGQAGLALLDQEDLLESGIDIFAQPPGKRLQNVSLLSGGEKALTAMALMFAIFRYRPSPFCLLDEIDAPLDDANIGRFLEMLRGMLDDTQFIIVTHSRKTMEMADRIYGVTMEEPGV